MHTKFAAVLLRLRKSLISPAPYINFLIVGVCSPHVAGYIAIALGRKYLVPPNITKELQEHAKAEVTGVPKGTTDLFAQRW